MNRIKPLLLLTAISAFALLHPLLSIDKEEKKMEIDIKSSAFDEGGFIPVKFTCDGQNISPPLEWNGVPEGTQSLALISDDPDAPMGTWVHWVVYNIPPDINGLEEGIPKKEILANDIEQGLTDFGSVGYGGPCPPRGTHRYFFKIFALDRKFNFKPGLTKSELLEKIKDNIIGRGELIGKYKRI